MTAPAPEARPLCALTIAGSDSGAGAGIQADLKTFAAYGVHGLSVLTALTAQNTRGVSAVHVPPTGFLAAQLEAVLSDFRVAAVKLGMLADAQVIHAVAELLERHAPPCVVLDPVMVASTGARLLAADALDALRTRLLPLATLVTPNLPEAELLLGQSIADPGQAAQALSALLALGARAVLLKGGHMQGADPLQDLYGSGSARRVFSHARLALEGHGTGCTLAAAVAAAVCNGLSLEEACQDATDYVHGALQNAYRPGLGQVVVLDHMWRLRQRTQRAAGVAASAAQLP